MRITRAILQPPPPPPVEIQMAFTRDEGWVIIAALHEYALLHPDAAHHDRWVSWTRDLDAELRR